MKPLVHTVRPKSKSIFIDKQITKIRLGVSYKLAILGHRYLASPDKEHEIRKLQIGGNDLDKKKLNLITLVKEIGILKIFPQLL